MPVATKIQPITGMLKRGIVVDISSAIGLGVASAYFFWYANYLRYIIAASRNTKIAIAYHIPAVRHRDRFYAKLEDQRIKNMGQEPRIPSEDE